MNATEAATADKKPLFVLSDNMTFYELVKLDRGVMEPLGRQSIKITLKCGCTQVFHPLAGEHTATQAAKENQQFFTELCKIHK